MFLPLCLILLIPIEFINCDKKVPTTTDRSYHERRTPEMVPQEADENLEEKEFAKNLKDDDGSDEDSIDTFNGTHYLNSHDERYGKFHRYDLLYRDIPNGKSSKNVGIDIELLAEYVEQDKEGENEDAPIFIASMDDIVNKLKKWHENIPRVHPFYAIKCNDDANVARVLATLGAGFDCASIVSIS